MGAVLGEGAENFCVEWIPEGCDPAVLGPASIGGNQPSFDNLEDIWHGLDQGKTLSFDDELLVQNTGLSL